MCDEECHFVMDKKYLRGKVIDMSSLVRNIPGRITLVDDPEKDLQEIWWPDDRKLLVDP
jgi:hypothetical protein